MKKRKAAFTLVEMVVAMAIFSLILAFVYKTFFSFAQTTKASAEATTKVQRDRIALKTIEDAFSGLVYYEQNQSIYGFVVNTEDYDYPSISFVSRVPPDFLGNKEFGSERLRRITFQVEDDEDYGRSLVMYQSSTLQPMEPLEVEEPSRWVLGQDLDTFLMVFWSTINGEWVYEWTETNSIPTRIKFEMAYVRADGSAAQVEDMQKREIVIFSESITKNMQNPTLPSAKGGGKSGGKPSSGRKPLTREQIAAYRKKREADQKKREDAAKRDGRKLSPGSKRVSDYGRYQKTAKRYDQNGDGILDSAERQKWKDDWAASKNSPRTPSGAGKTIVSTNPGSGSGAGTGAGPGDDRTTGGSLAGGSSVLPGALVLNGDLAEYKSVYGEEAETLQDLVDVGLYDSMEELQSTAPDGAVWEIDPDTGSVVPIYP